MKIFNKRESGIIGALMERSLSATQLAKELELPKPVIYYNINELLNSNIIIPARAIQRTGAPTIHYTVTNFGVMLFQAVALSERKLAPQPQMIESTIIELCGLMVLTCGDNPVINVVEEFAKERQIPAPKKGWRKAIKKSRNRRIEIKADNSKLSKKEQERLDKLKEELSTL